MDYSSFSQIVVNHRNSIILIGILVLLFIIVGLFVVELYVRRKLECPYFSLGKLKFSPTLLMLIPLIFAFVFFPVKIYQCNYDLKHNAYETYVGFVEYSESSVKLTDKNTSIFVGKGHEIVPDGKNYGKVVYSTKSHVIVFFESGNKSS